MNGVLFTNFFYLIYVITTIAVLGYLIYEDRDPAETVFWVMEILLLPYIGLIIFFFFGRDWRRGTAKSRAEQKKYKDDEEKFMPIYHQKYETFHNDFMKKHSEDWLASFASLSTEINNSPVVPANSVKILPSGEIGFAALKEDLKKAKKFIHMAYFIWEKDVLTKELMEILLERLENNVEVRLSYDFLGSLTYRKSELKKLKEAGAKVFPDVTDINRFNYRNHRKITVIDGEIGYTGGINIGQEYIDGGKSYPAWRDTFVRVTGPVVSEFQRIFAIRWNIFGNENMFQAKYFPVQPVIDNTISVQSNYSSSELYWESARDIYLKAILAAKNKVYIQSPYFVPDQALAAALETASLSGVDVRLIMTGWPDKKVAWWAAQTFFERLLKAGMKIYYYEKGFFHTKTLAIDDDLVSIGTTNFDLRSFTLQRENTLLIYDKDVVEQHYMIFNDDLTESKEFTLEEYYKLSLPHKFRNSFSKLLSNLF